MDQIIFLQGSVASQLVGGEVSAGTILKLIVNKTVAFPIANPLLPIIRAGIVNNSTRRFSRHAWRVNNHASVLYQI